MWYPSSDPKEFVENIHGHEVRDDYRWLEDGRSSKVKTWTAEQNRLTDRVIASSLRDKIESRIEESYKFPDVKAPFYTPAGLYFWTERQIDEDQSVLYVRSGHGGEKRELLNPNKWGSKDHIFSLDYWYVSNGSEYIAYGVSEGGNELSVLKILNVETGKDAETVVQNASWSSICWAPDDSGLFYTRHPSPGSVPEGEERYHQRVCYHHLGANSSKDIEIFGEGRHKEDSYNLELSVDGKYLVISAGRDWERNDLYLYDAASHKVSDLITGYDAQFSLSFTRREALLYTNYKAPNGRVLSAPIDDMPKNPDDWANFIKERKDKLEWFQITKDQILATYLINATERCVRFSAQGKELGELDMPAQASLLRISAHWDEEEFFYEFASFITAGVTYRYDPMTKKSSEYHRMGSVINEDDYIVNQEWFNSKDKTKVPMFIVHRRDLKKDGNNPTILYGYGGFELSLTPGFLRSYIPWLEAGGVYAAANIRGGGEFGKAWHTGGIKKNKQKSYDDFIAAAEHLINKKYTDAGQLGIIGGSNGGLLVGTVAMQRPELFKAVISQVPLTDMVRFPNFLIASRWIAEYGDPTKAEDLGRILKFSPYHNVKDDLEYPAFLFTTAENDTRVDPMHARKMTALMQSLEGDNPVLLFTKTDAGHAGSLTMSSFYSAHARVLAFFSEQLGLKIP